MDLIPWVYNGAPQWAEIASISKVLFEQAKNGDSVAKEIVSSCGQDLLVSIL